MAKPKIATTSLAGCFGDGEVAHFVTIGFGNEGLQVDWGEIIADVNLLTCHSFEYAVSLLEIEVVR